MYSFLGERLRAGQIPGWNPYQFAGAPFAADPGSGWGYLPAMLFFTALPLPAAAALFVMFHLALAGLSAYALARVLGQSIAGGLVAGAAFECSGWFYRRAVCCPAYVEVAAWLPLLLLAGELAITSRTWFARIGWWGLAGFALSQVLAAWIGQGAYYALLLFGSFVAYRTLLAPPASVDRPRDRLLAFGLHLGVPVALGFGLATAGLLPRLAFQTRSTLAAGYQGDLTSAARIGGWPLSVEGMIGPLLGGGPPSTTYFIGGATFVLALTAPLIARARFATPYFGGLALTTLILTSQQTTPLHAVLFALLPRFEELHRHWPERITTIFCLAPALLAGATISALPRLSRLQLLAVSLVPILAVAVLGRAWEALPLAPVGR